ncbi:MAG: creatininase family protein [Clostridia bacterium]|nr:creatininase family protein [Clostridia bacterium]
MKKTKLADMTWVEVKELVQERHPAVIVPIGTNEAQGLHMPMGYDHFVAEAISIKAAERCNAVVAPTICYGYSELFKEFPGTLTLQPETLQNLIYDVTVSLLRAGFTHIVFMNNHDPNTPILGFAMQRIRNEFGYIMPAIWPTSLARYFAKPLFSNADRILVHGNEPGTSLCMALFPEKVRLDLATETPSLKTFGDIPFDQFLTLEHEGQKVQSFTRASDVSETGALGYPDSYDPEIGAQIVESMVNYTASFVERYLKTDNNLGV